MDIFFGGEITGYFLNFSNQNQLNDHFNDYGVGDMNFLNNTGSLVWPIFLGMFLWYVLTVIINMIAKRNYRSKNWRWLAIKVFPVDDEFNYNVLTYFIEAYTG